MKTIWIRLVEVVLLISLLWYKLGSFAYTISPLLGYIVLFLIFILITDISATLLIQKTLFSGYLLKPKIRIFYISCGVFLTTFAIYCIRIWDITSILGSDTSSLFWNYLLPLNIAIAISMLLVLTLISLTNPNKNKYNFVPMIIGVIVSMLWWARIYQKCMDKSILFTSSNTVDMKTYLFYIGTAILIIFVTVVVTLYISLQNQNPSKQTRKISPPMDYGI